MEYISLEKQEQIKVKGIMKKYKQKYLLKKIERSNDKYIKKEIEKAKLLDNISGYSLDMQQKKAVITDEDASLIVAGAGSGKTLTMIGKLIYLIKYKNINPKEILCISFTNFTTMSFKKALDKNNLSNIDVFTFHKLSLEILKKKGININICSDNLLIDICKQFFKRDLLLDKKLLYDFVINYLLISNINLNDHQSLKLEQEIIISNYLYFNNIKYEYKMVGTYKDKTIYAFYLNDYNLYIKYYDLKETEEILKISDHLLEINITRKYFDCKVLEIYLHNFIDCNVYEVINNFLKENNVKIKQKTIEEIYCIFTSKGNNLLNLIITFINLFKANNYPYIKFDEIKDKISKKRQDKNKQLTILNIIMVIYNKYQLFLKQNNLVDFNDMIIEATNLINNYDVILNYKYIIIDEYQDTSYVRYNLIKSIKDKCDAKLVAVGDDFQSIYRFTGCDVNMFVYFDKYFKYSKILYLTNTYRNSQELITVAGDFIMKNKFQIKKNLHSPKHLNKCIKIYFYQKKDEISNLFSKIEENNIFVLGRNNSDINYCQKFDICDNKIKYLNKDITFMSVHKSKGLECDAVVIVNLEDKILGFPSKCEENILLSYLSKVEESYPFDEERRLFYVALTRTKGKVYLFVPFKKRSIFVTEIIKDHRKLIEFIN